VGEPTLGKVSVTAQAAGAKARTPRHKPRTRSRERPRREFDNDVCLDFMVGFVGFGLPVDDKGYAEQKELVLRHL
jgi:hypothetical protein